MKGKVEFKVSTEIVIAALDMYMSQILFRESVKYEISSFDERVSGKIYSVEIKEVESV